MYYLFTVIDQNVNKLRLDRPKQQQQQQNDLLYI